jgi:hypothetical protein
MNSKDITIVRDLARRVAEIAALPVQAEKRRLWKNLNMLKPERPMVMIDQICWNELNVNDELSVQCTDPDCRNYEWMLRSTLYKWNHFPVDMVVEPFIMVHKAVHNSGFGFTVEEETVQFETDNSVLSHKFTNLFETEEDLEKIKTPIIRHDQSETARRLQVAHNIFDGILEVRTTGISPYLSIWDPVSTWMGVENALYAMIDKPDYIHRLVKRITDGYLNMLDQLEGNGLLCKPQDIIHCTGAYTDELPAPGYNPEKPRTKDIWMFGLAQMFSTVSPDMFKEFEVDYTSRICKRFGLVYYGCCDPLDGKMAEVRMIPNVRKISMSPWANHQRGAEEIGKDFVFSCKPNPANIAMTGFDSDLIRAELTATFNACKKHGCPLEFILKDISTIGHHPERLDQWAEIAMEIARG